MLAATRVTCPNCTKTLKLAQEPPVGKRLRCPQCGCPFTVSANDLGMASSPAQPPRLPATPSSAVQMPPALPSLHAPVNDAAPPNRGLLLAGILGGLVLLLGGATALALYFANRDTNNPQQASADAK